MSAVSMLLDSLVDYAGLFPPAQLGMSEAVRNHVDYLAGPHRAVLGRFVVPLVRLAEFEASFARLPATAQRRWRLSVLAGPDPRADADAILAFNARYDDARIVSVETKATNSADVARWDAPFGPGLEVWVEVSPAAPDLGPLLIALRTAGRGAKLRTGGATPNAFPAPAEVAQFLRMCHETGIVMKATAGLHHPLCGDYQLTYEIGSPRALMFGFLNLFLAAALIHAGGTETEAVTLLDDADASHFTAASDTIAWRGHHFTAAQLDATRRTLCRSFGSCSFTEPIEGLRKLRWI